MKRQIYMDYAATTPMLSEVVAAMQPYFSDKFYNPSATYLAAQDVAKSVEGARATIAQHLGAKPSEIIFTAGGTEANNLALFGIADMHPNAHIVTTAIEHESVLAPLKQLAKHGQQVSIVQPQPSGVIDPAQIAAAITDKTVLVTIMYANNELGTIQPIHQIAQILQQIRKKRQQQGSKTPIYLHTDACQAGNYLDLHVHRLGVDLMTINAGKVYGPKQCGALYIRAGVNVEPLMFGGGQERNLRSGTPNVANIIGFAKALTIVQTSRHTEAKRLAELQQLFYELLNKEVPTAIITGSLKHRLPNNVHVTLPGEDNERLMMALDEQGIMAATGSACSASNDEPSHVLAAIGLNEVTARSSLRFSMGRNTTQSDIVDTVTSLRQILK